MSKSIVPLKTLMKILDAIDDPVYIADTETLELLHVNSAANEVWGNDIVGKKCYSIIHGKKGPCSFCTNPIILDKFGETYYWEHQNDVSGRWYRCADKAIDWSDGRIVRFEMVSDITDNKRLRDELLATNQQLKASEQQMKAAMQQLEATNQQLEASYQQLKASEQATMEYARMNSQLIQNSPGIVFRCLNDKNWTMKFISEVFEEITGYAPETFLENKDKSYNDIIHPEDRDYVWNTIQKAIADNEQFKLEYRIKDTDGNIKWVWEQGQAVSSNGDVIIEGMIMDITERMEMENALRYSEDRFRSIAENAQEFIWEVNARGKFTYVNPLCEELYGYSQLEMLNMHFYDLAPDEIREEIMKGKKPFRNTVSRCQRKDGKEIWIQSNGVPIVSPQGELVGFRGSDIDITEQKRMGQELKESEEKFRTLFEDSMDMVYITDRDGNILEINRAGCEMLGYEPDELIGINALDTYANPEDRGEFIRALEQEGKVNNYELELSKKDGSRIFCLVSSNVQRDKDGNILGYRGIVHDITQRRILELQKFREQERAEFYNDLMAHDINNFNQAILSNLELIKSFETSPRVQEFADNALKQIKGSTELIQNLNKIKQLQNEEAQVHDMDVIPFLEEAIDNVRSSYPSKDIKINLNYDLDSAIIRGNGLIKDVFYNIIANAVKFDRNPVVEIDIDVTADNDDYRLVFKDHGPGIADSFKEAVFDRTRRLDPERWGTGLGLTVVKFIINSINGKIWVEDRVPGNHREGSNFIIIIPRGGANG